MVRFDRRGYLSTLSASAFAVAAGCTAPTTDRSGVHSISESGNEWPSFRGDRFNTGFAKGVEPTSDDPSITWETDTDGPIWSSPVVADDTVFIGSADNSLYALDAGSGDEQWSYPTNHRIEGAPAYADGTVYVGSYDMHVYAIDAASGEERWSRELGGLIRASPTVHDGTVVIGVGCYNLACGWYAAEEGAPENGWVYAFDADTGETEWSYPVGEEVVSTPAVDAGRVYVGASDGTLYAIDLDSGEDVWTYDAGDMIWSSPALAYGTIYFGDWAGLVHAVDAETGDEKWTAVTNGDYVSGSVAVDETGVYIGDTPHNTLDDPNTYVAEFFKFDRTSGEEVWSVETEALEIGSSAVVTDDLVYFSTHGQTEREGLGVHAITTDGTEEWFLEIGGRGVGSSPALVDGTLYFGGTDASVYAVE